MAKLLLVGPLGRITGLTSPLPTCHPHPTAYLDVRNINNMIIDTVILQAPTAALIPLAVSDLEVHDVIHQVVQYSAQGCELELLTVGLDRTVILKAQYDVSRIQGQLEPVIHKCLKLKYLNLYMSLMLHLVDYRMASSYKHLLQNHFHLAIAFYRQIFSLIHWQTVIRPRVMCTYDLDSIRCPCSFLTCMCQILKYKIHSLPGH